MLKNPTLSTQSYAACEPHVALDDVPPLRRIRVCFDHVIIVSKSVHVRDNRWASCLVGWVVPTARQALAAMLSKSSNFHVSRSEATYSSSARPTTQWDSTTEVPVLMVTIAVWI